MSTIDLNQQLTHCGITAPRHLWIALNYEVSQNAAGETEVYRGPYKGEADLYAARLATGADDWRALAWLAQENARRAEEKTRVTAQAREAEALGALAAAIKGSANEEVLSRILGRLSERTQYAVRQQLKGNPL